MKGGEVKIVVGTGSWEGGEERTNGCGRSPVRDRSEDR